MFSVLLIAWLIEAGRGEKNKVFKQSKGKREDKSI